MPRRTQITCPHPDGTRTEITGFVLETWWINARGHRRSPGNGATRQRARLAVHLGTDRYWLLETTVPGDLRPAERGETLTLTATLTPSWRDPQLTLATVPMTRDAVRRRELRRQQSVRDRADGGYPPEFPDSHYVDDPGQVTDHPALPPGTTW